MDIQKERLLLLLFAALGLNLLPLGLLLQCSPLIYAALLCYIAAVVIWFAFNRCPHCHKHLGRHTGVCCPYCKEKL